MSAHHLVNNREVDIPGDHFLQRLAGDCNGFEKQTGKAGVHAFGAFLDVCDASLNKLFDLLARPIPAALLIFLYESDATINGRGRLYRGMREKAREGQCNCHGSVLLYLILNHVEE